MTLPVFCFSSLMRLWTSARLRRSSISFWKVFVLLLFSFVVRGGCRVCFLLSKIDFSPLCAVDSIEDLFYWCKFCTLFAVPDDGDKSANCLVFWSLTLGTGGAFTSLIINDFGALSLAGGGLDARRLFAVAADELYSSAPVPKSFLVCLIFIANSFGSTGNLGLYLSGYWISRIPYI